MLWLYSFTVIEKHIFLEWINRLLYAKSLSILTIKRKSQKCALRVISHIFLPQIRLVVPIFIVFHPVGFAKYLAFHTVNAWLYEPSGETEKVRYMESLYYRVIIKPRETDLRSIYWEFVDIFIIQRLLYYKYFMYSRMICKLVSVHPLPSSYSKIASCLSFVHSLYMQLNLPFIK